MYYVVHIYCTVLTLVILEVCTGVITFLAAYGMSVLLKASTYNINITVFYVVDIFIELKTHIHSHPKINSRRKARAFYISAGVFSSGLTVN